MAPKLIYLLMDCETFNQLPALEQVTSASGLLQRSTLVIFPKIIYSVNLNLLTILEKRFLDAFLSLECTSVGVCN